VSGSAAAGASPAGRMAGRPNEPGDGGRRGAAASAHERLGLLLGLAACWRLSDVPMTRLAVSELDAWFVGFGRMALAGW